MRYRKKQGETITVDAFKHTGELRLPACYKDYDETIHAPEWVAVAGFRGILFFDISNPVKKPELCARLPDGGIVHIPVGHYIVRVNGTDIYPCEPNLFEMSYILVTEESEEADMDFRNKYESWGNEYELLAKKKQEFEEAIKPLHEWLCKYGDPYTSVVVMQDRATVHQEYMTTPLPVPD